MKKHTVFDCSLIELDRHTSERLGTLSVASSCGTLPFDIKRVFFIFDVPAGATRGGHAHRDIREFVVALSGSFAITLDDGKSKRTVHLNRPFNGLLIEPGVWLTLHDFSSGAVALAITSDHFDPADHIKDYDEFLKISRENIAGDENTIS